jgi:hypothetical protein
MRKPTQLHIERSVHNDPRLRATVVVHPPQWQRPQPQRKPSLAWRLVFYGTALLSGGLLGNSIVAEIQHFYRGAYEARGRCRSRRIRPSGVRQNG